MKKKIILCLVVFSIILTLYSRESKIVIENKVSNELILNDTTLRKHTVLRDYVPDEETAKKIAEAVWFPIYGEEVLKQKPYKAELVNDIWIVRGVPYIPPYENPDAFRGGTAYIAIQKRDCKVLKITHGR